MPINHFVIIKEKIKKNVVDDELFRKYRFRETLNHRTTFIRLEIRLK